MTKLIEYIKINKKKYYIISFILALILATMAYNFYPRNGNYDLSLYYNIMDMLKAHDAEYTRYFNNNIDLFMQLYMYIIIGIGNYRLLQFFPVFIFYSIMFYIIFDYCKNYKNKKSFLVLVLLFFLSLFKFVFIASSIRYSLAYMIFTLGLYLDLVKKNKSFFVKLLYVIPIFIHSTCFMLLFFRLLIEIKKKKIVFGILLIIIIISNFPQTIISFLVLFKNIHVVSLLINKIYGYLIVENMPLYLQIYFRVFQTIFLIVLGVQYYIDEKNRTNEMMRKYAFLLILVGIFSICMIKYYTIFMRMIDFILFMSPIILFKMLIIFNKKNKKLFSCMLIIMILLICGGIYIQAPDFISMYF